MPTVERSSARARPSHRLRRASHPEVLRCSTTMRILVAGASGVVGRATLPHLTRHDVAGLTRSPEKLGSLRDLGAEPILCDVYDHERLLRVTQRFRPRIVVNFLTDLSAGSVQRNVRIRREGGANLLNAARATAARRLVVESVAFALDGEAAQAVEQLEQTTREFAGESGVLGTGSRISGRPRAFQGKGAARSETSQLAGKARNQATFPRRIGAA